MSSIYLNGQIKYLKEGEMLILEDYYGNKIKVQWCKLQIGDIVVMYSENSRNKDGKLVSHVPTQKYVTGNVEKLNKDYRDGSGIGRVLIEGRWWHEDLVFKFIEDVEE